ncbi:hypothetical protein OF83DRAFT_1199377 [Amylostereum chailletii]|nr:hypothetical protein OF83DRAFT_1199377 [Amylostereum chailletii]
MYSTSTDWVGHLAPLPSPMAYNLAGNQMYTQPGFAPPGMVPSGQGMMVPYAASATPYAQSPYNGIPASAPVGGYAYGLPGTYGGTYAPMQPASGPAVIVHGGHAMAMAITTTVVIIITATATTILTATTTAVTAILTTTAATMANLSSHPCSAEDPTSYPPVPEVCARSILVESAIVKFSGCKVWFGWFQSGGRHRVGLRQSNNLEFSVRISPRRTLQTYRAACARVGAPPLDTAALLLPSLALPDVILAAASWVQDEDEALGRVDGAMAYAYYDSFIDLESDTAPTNSSVGSFDADISSFPTVRLSSPALPPGH